MAFLDPRGSRARSVLLCLVFGSLSACLGTPDRPAEPVASPSEDEELPVIQMIVGEFDGHELTFHTLQPDEIEALARQQEGLAVEPLVDIPSMPCATCTGTDYVAFSTVAASRRAITNGAAQGTTSLWTSTDVPNCGPVPTTGACQQVRMRNMYPVQIERAYAELIQLAPTGDSTAVSVPPQPYSAVNDFGVIADFANGMWRYGELGRSVPAGAGPTAWWAFTGSTPAGTNFTFRFVVQVRGLIVRPTHRASLPSGQLDAPDAAGYPSRTAGTSLSSSHVSISDNGRYVAFATNNSVLTGASGNFVVRKDLSDGSLVVVNPIACTHIAHPHLSADGSVVAFQAYGCDLTAEGAAAASPQVYAHAFGVGTTLITRTPAGGYANGTNQQARISADGNVIAFQSTSTNVIDGIPTADRAGCIEVYRHDRALGATTHVSALAGADIFDPAAGWVPACSGSQEAGQTPDISGDGNLVVLASYHPLQTSDTLTGRDVYVYDHAATEGAGVYIVYRVSLTPGGANLDQVSFNLPSISRSGAFVAFSTTATNIAGTSASRRHVYRRSSTEGANSTIELVTRRVDDAEASGSTSGIPALSSTGRFVAFWSAANDLAADGSFSVTGTQVYVCDMDAPIVSLERCWVASTVQPDAASAFAVLSGTAAAATRIGIAYPSDIDAGFLAFQANPSAGTWSTMGGNGNQVFVSAASTDPRYQQATITR